jgi:hypothetical protein
MNTEFLIREAQDILDVKKTELTEYGTIDSMSIVYCKNKSSIMALVLEGSMKSEECDQKNEKKAHMELVKQTITKFKAIAVIHIGGAWIREKTSENKALSASGNPHRTTALILVASMPEFCFGIAVPYSSLGDKIVFAEETIFKVDESMKDDVYRTLLNVWNSDKNFSELCYRIRN